MAERYTFCICPLLDYSIFCERYLPNLFTYYSISDIHSVSCFKWVTEPLYSLLDYSTIFRILYLADSSKQLYFQMRNIIKLIISCGNNKFHITILGYGLTLLSSNNGERLCFFISIKLSIQPIIMCVLCGFVIFCITKCHTLYIFHFANYSMVFQDVRLIIMK